MSLIEEAAKRLQQLKQAGIEVPAEAGAGARPREELRRDPTPQRAAVAAQARLRARAPALAPDERREPVLREESHGPGVRSIDLARLHAAGFVTPGTDSKLHHEFRIVKRPLIQNAMGKSAGHIAKPNLIMVTSALPGEGKSFVSINLAMSIAMEVDCRVLLVDADVIAPSIPRLLGLPPAKGLMDVLTGPQLGLGDVILKTDVPRLSLMLAGTPHRQSSELLASDALGELLLELSSRYADRIVVFDSPPLLATTESRVLASHMGQVVVVVEAERTTHGALESALSTVETCPVVMTMLNKAAESEAGSYYGYYGYGR